MAQPAVLLRDQPFRVNTFDTACPQCCQNLYWETENALGSYVFSSWGMNHTFRTCVSKKSSKTSYDKDSEKPWHEPLAPRSCEFQILSRFSHQYKDYQYLAVVGSYFACFSLCLHIPESECAVFLAELLCFCTSQQLSSLTAYLKIRCSSRKTDRKWNAICHI